MLGEDIQLCNLQGSSTVVIPTGSPLLTFTRQGQSMDVLPVGEKYTTSGSFGEMREQ